ncbi:MAG: DUF3017 domain-containing protein [Demequina sp.]
MNEPHVTPVTVALAALGGAVGIVALGLMTDMRWAVLVLAVYALAGAVARIVVPATAAFAVRRRAVDVSVLLVLGLALGYLGLTTPLN